MHTNFFAQSSFSSSGLDHLLNFLELHPAEQTVVSQKAKALKRRGFRGDGPEKALSREAFSSDFELLAGIEIEDAVGGEFVYPRVELKDQELSTKMVKYDSMNE